MTPSKTIIFDLDGTLIHSAPDLQVAVNKALASVGRPALDLQRVTSFIGNGVETLVARSLALTGGSTEELQADVLARFRQCYDAEMTTLTQPYPGVLDTLDALKSEGYRLGICTNKPDAPAKHICDALALTDYFDVISGVRPGCPKKPDPAPLLTCIADLGSTAEAAIYVGDSGVDHATAQNARVPFRLFLGGYLNAELAEFAGTTMFDAWSVDKIIGAARAA